MLCSAIEHFTSIILPSFRKQDKPQKGLVAQVWIQPLAFPSLLISQIRNGTSGKTLTWNLLQPATLPMDSIHWLLQLLFFHHLLPQCTYFLCMDSSQIPLYTYIPLVLCMVGQHRPSLKALPLGQDGTLTTYLQIPPSNRLTHCRLGFEIILPINIISMLNTPLNSAKTKGWTTVHTWNESTQICSGWQLSNMGNSCYGMTVLGRRHTAGQPLQTLKEIYNSYKCRRWGTKKNKEDKWNSHLTSSWSINLKWHKINLPLSVFHSNQVLLKPHCKW